MAVHIFITNDKPNVAGLVLAGSADFKTELSQSDLFDQRLKNIIISVVDVSYGMRMTHHWICFKNCFLITRIASTSFSA